MTYVVDASIVAKWFVAEVRRREALELLNRIEDLCAPEFIVPEVANVFWKKCLRGEITQEQARTAVAAVPQYLQTLVLSTGLSDRALEIAFALAHPVYDCLYLACAEDCDGILVTDDQRLFDAVKDGAFEPLVRHLTDPDLLRGS